MLYMYIHVCKCTCTCTSLLTVSIVKAENFVGFACKILVKIHKINFKILYLLEVLYSMVTYLYSGKFWRELNLANLVISIAIRQNKIRHFEPLYTCSMARGHKFAKLKVTNHQNLAIHQILVPPKFPVLRYVIVL